MRKTRILFLIATLILFTNTFCACAKQTGPYFNIKDYGAIADGNMLCTKAIQKAVDQCAKSGGKVIIPSGKYLTGPIFLKSNIHVEILTGATLLGSTNICDYPPVDGRWEGIEQKIHASMFTGHNLENITISGQGILNGQGQVWWEADRKTRQVRKAHGITGREPSNPPEAPLKWPRPRVINLYRCKNVLIRDITILDSPSWTIHPVYCENVTVDNVKITAPFESPNTDGVNPDSCKNVRISNCLIDTGDDCITLKSGYNQDGRRVGIPCENITITNCIFASKWGGVVIGSEMSGDVRNVTVSNCIFDGTSYGLRFKTSRGRGGIVENIRVSNIVMRNIKGIALGITGFYDRDQTESIPPVTVATPTIRNIFWRDISIIGANKAAVISGLPEMPFENINLSDIHVVSAKTGMEFSTANGLTLDNVVVNAEKGPALSITNTRDVEMYRFATHKPNKDTPVVVFEDVTGALVQNCKAVENTDTFLGLKGDKNTDIEMRLNRLSKAAKQMEKMILKKEKE